jgi:sterol desaturase/sphingolipid hydroxylase (fatty acid hydroxylase superfamily)
MSSFILTHEPAIRLAFFLGMLLLMAAWEVVAPRRTQRLTLPLVAVDIAALGERRGWGLLNNIALPGWAKLLLALVALDLAIYLQHVMFHAVPALWRLHRMHHADLDFDVTTGARFHPFELLLSTGLKLGIVAALGVPAAGVVTFEVMINATAMFNHGNVRLPARLDRYLRWLIVTPDMHRVHHSAIAPETNSNFGFNLPWWDRLLGTYLAQPAMSHERMRIGLDEFRDPAQLRLDRMLIQPFVGETGHYPMPR